MEDFRKKQKKSIKYLLERNIKLLYMRGALAWGRFFVPVMALFYIASQVPLEQFAIIMGVFTLSTLLFEIPSGVLSDLLGRKKSLVIAHSIYIVEIIILAFFNGFWWFLIAKFISGIASSLISGTDSSLLYETLKKLKREKEYKKIYGKAKFIRGVFMSVIFILGGYLFTLNYKYPAYLSLPFMILGLIVSIFLMDVNQRKQKVSIEKSWNHMKEGIVFFSKNIHTKFITIYSVPLMTLPWIVLAISSAYLELIKIPIVLIGIISFIGSTLMAFAAKNTHHLEEKFGEKKTLNILYLLGFIGLVPLIFLIPYFGVLSLLLIFILNGFADVIIDHYMNKHVKSSHRATMLSIRNMFNQLLIAICFPIFGYITKLFSMAEAFAFLFIILGLGFVYYLIYSGKYTKTQKNKTYI